MNVNLPTELNYFVEMLPCGGSVAVIEAYLRYVEVTTERTALIRALATNVAWFLETYPKHPLMPAVLADEGNFDRIRRYADWYWSGAATPEQWTLFEKIATVASKVDPVYPATAKTLLLAARAVTPELDIEPEEPFIC